MRWALFGVGGLHLDWSTLADFSDLQEADNDPTGEKAQIAQQVGAYFHLKFIHLPSPTVSLFSSPFSSLPPFTLSLCRC